MNAAVYTAIVVIFFLVLWIIAPLFEDKDACPYGCRLIEHDGGPYGIPTVINYVSPDCPDHSRGDR